ATTEASEMPRRLPSSHPRRRRINEIGPVSSHSPRTAAPLCVPAGILDNPACPMSAMTDHIDSEGFRANVGIILANADGKLLLAGRIGNKGWQFPQGGMLVGESEEAAMYRELHEEIGLRAEDVQILGVTRDWLRYR